jgi:hypothetical protein
VKNSPSGSWRAQSRPLYNTVTQALVAANLGDDRRALEIGRDVAPKLEALTPVDEFSTREKANTRRNLALPMALAAYSLGDAAAAEQFAAVALQQWKLVGTPENIDRRNEGEARLVRAMALVRLGRHDEARALVGPVLAMHRDLTAINRGSVLQRFELAQALIAASASGLGDARAQRAEAARLLDGLPEELRNFSAVKFWRARLAEVAARP